MKEKLVAVPGLPQCAGDFRLDAITSRKENEILEAVLECATAPSFSGRARCPRFADSIQVERDKAETAANFGWHGSTSHKKR